jgi:hypothetical protein
LLLNSLAGVLVSLLGRIQASPKVWRQVDEMFGENWFCGEISRPEIFVTEVKT